VQLYRARRVLARRLILDYPNIQVIDDLPPELVHAFDTITDIIGDQHPARYLATFAQWWKVRKTLRENWFNNGY